MTQIQFRRDTAANWATANPVLTFGEPGWDSTNGLLKLGDGTTAWASLPSLSTLATQAWVSSNFWHILNPTGTKTGAYPAVANDLVMCDVSGGGFTVTLPTAPPNGTTIAVDNLVAGTLTVAAGGSDVFNKSGGPTTQSLLMQNQIVIYQYSSGVWFSVSQSIPLAQIDTRYLNVSVATAKGDLYAATASGTVSRFGAGSNGQMLMAQSGQAAGLQYNNVPWCPEMVLTSKSAVIVAGYNDMPGGISVEPGINAAGVTLDAVWLRVGDLSTANSGGDIICDVYSGTKSTQGTNVISLTLSNGSQDVIGTLGTSATLAANAVIRAYLTPGTTTLAQPLHLQLRGRYLG